MLIGRIPNATRVLGASQGYHALPIRDENIRDPAINATRPFMASAWMPTPAELVRLLMGASVILRLMGREHPPTMLDVGRTPDRFGDSTALKSVIMGVGFEHDEAQLIADRLMSYGLTVVPRAKEDA
jgi:hypothetical protein